MMRNDITKTVHRCTTMMYNKPCRRSTVVRLSEKKRREKSSRSLKIRLYRLDTRYCVNVEKSLLCYICYVRDFRVV